MTFRLQLLPIHAAFVLVPSLAAAHTGHGEASGFLHGLSHPIFGVDHVLVMVMIGIFACQLGGRAIWTVPGAFLAAMAVGGLLGVSGIALPIAETGILVSVVSLAVIIVFRVKMPVTTAVAVSSFFAIFHGYAHGAEIPQDASSLAYAGGFLAATALLHVAGLGFGFVWRQNRLGLRDAVGH